MGGPLYTIKHIHDLEKECDALQRQRNELAAALRTMLRAYPIAAGSTRDQLTAREQAYKAIAGLNE